MIVRGGDVVTPAGLRHVDVVVAGGRIAELGPAGTMSGSGRVLDAGGLLVLPGGVDPHVHFDEPGRTGWEGFDTGSAAAAAGGVTTVVDMPIDCSPPTVSAAAVAAKADAARAASRVDVAMWGGLVPGSVGALVDMVAAGVVGFKAFACPSGWDDFPPADSATLTAGCLVAAAAGIPVAVHCEEADRGHDAESEVAAVRWAATLAQQAGAHLHVVHASASEAVVEARRHPNVTVETCPHYLVLDDMAAARIGPAAHCSPPIRSAANRERLWRHVLDGAIDCVASDHSPCPPEWRAGPEPWAGIDGIGLTLPLLLSSGRLGIERIVELTTAAARILRLAGKGSLAIGYHADVVLVDPAVSWAVEPAALHTRHRASPYLGTRVRGRVVTTMVRGRVVYDGAEVAGPGGGEIVAPAHRLTRGAPLVTGDTDMSAPLSRP